MGMHPAILTTAARVHFAHNYTGRALPAAANDCPSDRPKGRSLPPAPASVLSIVPAPGLLFQLLHKAFVPGAIP